MTRRRAILDALSPLLLSAVVALGGVVVPAAADAFCGFYVSQSGDSLYANATRVAMMRHGQQTVMSMQNNYSGPPEDFAMVVPVPEVLEKKRVKTLEDGVFDRLDRLTSPRLVEYWQKNPCHKPKRRFAAQPMAVGGAAESASAGRGSAGDKVKVEAKFDVGEYEVVVLSAEESNALDTWLTNHEYNIPDGAPKYFRPYVQKGMYFFVAKVNLDKVQYEDGEAVLSPLRFHYEEDDFKLPVRLGLINSSGSQNLIVYLLAARQRYRVANYPNVTMPTNLPVANGVKGNFAAFYDELFSRVQDEHPKSVVTEYSWTATSCDPCPVEPLERSHLQTLGADVIDAEGDTSQGGGRPLGGRRQPRLPWTVTRLHTRYSEESLGQDLVFEKAPPIKGGRGEPEGGAGEMDHQTARQAQRNNFQSRYYIRHFWSGPAKCKNPNWGRWGGPPGGSGPNPSAAGDLGFRQSGGDVDLGASIEQDEAPKIGPVDSRGDGNGKDDEASSKTNEGAGPSTDEGNGGDNPSPEGEDSPGNGEGDGVDLDEAVEQEEIPKTGDGE